MSIDKTRCLELIEAMPEDESRATAAHIIECGVVHSGIPPCCVTWFLLCKLTDESHNQYRALLRRFFPGRYEPCPDCFKVYLRKGAFRKVKDCECECQCCGCERERSSDGTCRHGKTGDEKEEVTT